MSGAVAMIEKCLADGKPIAHSVCANVAAIQQFRETGIIQNSQLLDAMNEELLIYRYVVAPPTSDIELLRGHLIKVQEYAATVSEMLRTAQVKIKIHAIQDEAVVYKEKKTKERKEKTEKAETEQRTAERSAMLAAERKTPWLRDRRKSIESLAGLPGWTWDLAEKAIDDKTRASGKDPQTGEAIQ